MKPDMLIPARVSAVRNAARHIRIYELSAVDGSAFPPAEAGAHIDLRLPNGLVRQYSLLLENVGSDRYSIAIKKDERGRGGSSYIHENVGVGDVLTIGPLRNNFPLVEDARSTISHRRRDWHNATMEHATSPGVTGGAHGPCTIPAVRGQRQPLLKN